MFDLNEILEEVRSKYYCSSFLKKPTISWSEDYWTDYFGQYTLFDNHVIVSRVLNDDRVSREMLLSVVFHECIHQDIQDHDEDFEEQVKRFQRYYEIQEELENFITEARSNLVYTEAYNSFTENKRRLVYILLNRKEDYPDVFYSCNDKILVDFNATVNFDIDNEFDMFIFLVKNRRNYHIVGWCDKGILNKERIKVVGKKFGDDDYSYQLESSYDNTYVIPLTCCDYTIPCSEMPDSFAENNCCVYDISDKAIQSDISYIESYCEGYYKMGMDVRNMDCIPEFLDISVEDMKKIKRRSYAKIWLNNAIYEKEPSCDNLINRAVAKYEAWMTEAALSDFLAANLIEPENLSTAFDIIKIAVLLRKFNIAKEFIEKYKSTLPTDDKILNNLYKEVAANI